MYTGHKLIELLEKQHQNRQQSDLFKKGTFTIQWRAKVGSFPHPDVETIVSAGEPCGAWRASQGRPEDKRNVGENLQDLPNLPLNGYVPGSVIRGIVRSWAKQRPKIHRRMLQLLGYQDDDKIQSGKIEFLDAWPQQPQKLTLDIVNPQEHFQVYHQGQSKPLSFYTLGNGEAAIPVTVAIRGIPRKATAEEVAEVWGWVQQALTLYGVGSRTASGYGAIASGDISQPKPDPNYAIKTFDFSLYSQGCYGADTQKPELRPSHWRGWLRSWVLRFLLGVMSEKDAKETLWELFGVLEPDSCKGCVRSQMIKGEIWGDRSANKPYFYTWKGQLQISAPKDILNKIILPIIRFAVVVGGLGHGWRRPLHIFNMKLKDKRTGETREKPSSRGTHLILTHQVQSSKIHEVETKRISLPLNESSWNTAYRDWLDAVQSQWSNQVTVGINQQQPWEIFSPLTCAVYAVPGPDAEPVSAKQNLFEWKETNGEETRGDGMYLIYKETHPRNYKRNPELGGNAASGDNAHCSWASIKRVNIPNSQEKTGCQEIVCLFMGGQQPNSNHVRSRFLKDLENCYGSVHLFGVQPPSL
jgi:CRISPR-associated protein Cmr6